MIQSVNFGFFRTSESVQFFNNCVQICTRNNPEDLKISVQVVELEKSTNLLNSNFKSNTGSSITNDLVNLDARRDDAIICLRKIIDGFTNHFDPIKKQAAVNLLKIINKYGTSLSRLNYQSESSSLSNLGRELQTTPLAIEWLAVLNLTDVVSEMVEANDLFNDTFLARVEESAETNQVAMVGLIRDSITKFRTLTDHIQAHATLNPSAEFTKLIDLLNELIDEYNTTVSRRGSENKDHLEN